NKSLGQPALFNHFYYTMGTVIAINSQIKVKPSTLVRYAPGISPNVDISTSIYLKDMFGIGISVRNANTFVFLAEFFMNERYRVGYSYDYLKSIAKGNNLTSHEVYLNIIIKPSDSKRAVSPRYF
ncbi:MAG: type IX secretion system membrane protein PorP/SprF, partial [Bacteroidales bacterium]|nr:type IX secretion system membrane protein PorP/SprF [Bacteroidales bacterium]